MSLEKEVAELTERIAGLEEKASAVVGRLEREVAALTVERDGLLARNALLEGRLSAAQAEMARLRLLGESDARELLKAETTAEVLAADLAKARGGR